MKQMTASIVLFVAATAVTLLLLMLSQTPWAQGVRDATALTGQGGATRGQHGIGVLIFPFVKVVGAMFVPGLVAVGLNNLVNHFRPKHHK